jgi:hypothetical protein
MTELLHWVASQMGTTGDRLVTFRHMLISHVDSALAVAVASIAR